MPLRPLARKRLLEEMVEAVEGDSKVLIVDRYAMLLLSACCKNSELVARKVLVVESLQLARQPLPAFPAVYFMAPTAASVELAIADWETRRLYAHAHVFFTSRAPNNLIDMLGRAKMAQYLRTLRELLLDFRCFEGQVFTLAVDTAPSPALLGPPSQPDPLIRIGEQLLTLCSTLGEDPVIRFQNTEMATTVASYTQEKIDTLARLDPKFRPQCASPPATLLILDRTVDSAAPLLHEFTYQAMLYDLVTEGLKDSKYTHTFSAGSGKQVTREVLLDDNDPLWRDYRYRHISEVLPELNANLQKFLQSSKSITSLVKDKKEKDLKKMSEAVRQMPQYQQTVDNFSLHIGITGQLMDTFKQRHLDALALCEQLMATGEHPDGPKCTEKEARKELERVLVDPAATREDKMRLLMLYSINPGTERDALQLAPLADLGPTETNVISRLMNLKASKDEKPKKSFFSKTKKKKQGKAAMNKDTYDVSRYVPAVKGILEAEIGGTLSVEDFPYTKGPPPVTAAATSKAPAMGRSLRGPRTGASSSSVNPLAALSLSSGDTSPSCSGPRLLVFVVGGVTYSEIRSGAEIMREHQREVIVGGTSLLTPRDFIEALKLAPL